jgi:hypothetical protein
MSDVWARGICRWFRDRALPRVTARLCVVTLLLNLFAPILWAAAAPPPAVDTPIVCHDATPADAPSHPADHSTPTANHAPHCPLCVLFGGTAWAPPATAGDVVAPVPQRAAATAVRDETLLVRLPTTLRPSPRAPPFPI